MSVSLRPHVGVLVTGVALSAAILLVLPGVAEAQGTASVEDNTRDTNQNTGATMPMGSPDGTAGVANDLSATGVHEGAPHLVVETGDSLWSIARERLRPDATPEQIGNEVERIVELNRNLLGSNPDLILPGQELLVAPVAEPAVAEPTSPEPTSPEPLAAERVATTVESFPEPNNDERRLVGLGILVMSFVLASLIVVWRLPTIRDTKWETFVGYSNNYALPDGFEFTKVQGRRHPNRLNPNGSSAASKTKLPGRAVTPIMFKHRSRRRRREVKPRLLRTPDARRLLRQGAATGVHSPQIRRSLRHAFRTKDLCWDPARDLGRGG